MLHVVSEAFRNELILLRAEHRRIAGLHEEDTHIPSTVIVHLVDQLLHELDFIERSKA